MTNFRINFVIGVIWGVLMLAYATAVASVGAIGFAFVGPVFNNTTGVWQAMLMAVACAWCLTFTSYLWYVGLGATWERAKEGTILMLIVKNAQESIRSAKPSAVVQGPIPLSDGTEVWSVRAEGVTIYCDSLAEASAKQEHINSYGLSPQEVM